ncbi:MAG: hypothetical protein CO094_08890 [Anaerolineae bacterium CG_4_9_14_3_um_filter_57_17]|nr:hypothetical protein [bacterium]NCT21672.1 hypothetical protein [bacterium]OIO86736.1 MAG: hypothetical protein AUK01_02240 [Anaerolineae bacterium CG2_30_57_67]PJB65820.1 MAG: hypothetical protein CO094_08890 [Anaerolineae bacterium CG_4_9_14_3_um_filter_57_17]
MNLVPFFLGIVVVVFVVVFVVQAVFFAKLVKSGKTADAFAYILRTRLPAEKTALVVAAPEPQRDIPAYDDDSFVI